MLLSWDRLHIDVLQILWDAGVTRSIVGVGACLLCRTAERNELLVDNFQVAHVIWSRACSVGMVTILCVELSAVIRVRVLIMVIMLSLGQCLQPPSVVVLNMDSSSDWALFSLRIGWMRRYHLLASKGHLSLKVWNKIRKGDKKSWNN